MPRYDDDDKPRRSWREIDKSKDRSFHRKEDRPSASPHRNARADSASKVYRSKLDAFFDGEGKAPEHARERIEALGDASPEGKERIVALESIKSASTSAAAAAAVGAYLERWELPPDFDVLAQVLLCQDSDAISSALAVIGDLLDLNRAPRRKALLEQRLKRVASLADEPDVQDRARTLARKLRAFP